MGYKIYCEKSKFTVKNQNLPKCRIVAEFFHETPIREFFEVFKRIAQLGFIKFSKL